MYKVFKENIARANEPRGNAESSFCVFFNFIVDPRRSFLQFKCDQRIVKQKKKKRKTRLGSNRKRGCFVRAKILQLHLIQIVSLYREECYCDGYTINKTALEGKDCNYSNCNYKIRRNKQPSKRKGISLFDFVTSLLNLFLSLSHFTRRAVSDVIIRTSLPRVS